MSYTGTVCAICSWGWDGVGMLRVASCYTENLLAFPVIAGEGIKTRENTVWAERNRALSDWTIYHHPQIFQGHLSWPGLWAHRALPQCVGAVGAFALNSWYRWHCVGGRRDVSVYFFSSSENQRVGLIASPFQPAGTHCCTNTAPHFTQVAAPL